MTTSTRLTQIAKSLSPRQIAFCWVQKLRAFPNCTEQAASIASGKQGMSRPLWDQVADSVQVANKGVRREALHGQIREGYREAAFLISLAVQCNTSIENARYGIGMRRRLVSALLCWMMSVFQAGLDWDEHLPDPCIEAETHWWTTRAILNAVRLIEREYFEGQPILYPEAEDWLTHEVADATALASPFTSMPGAAERAETSAQEAERAREQALEWIAITRAEVHMKLGEVGAAERVMRSVLG